MTDTQKLVALLAEMRRAINQAEDKMIGNSDGGAWPALPKGYEHVIAFHRARGAAFMLRQFLAFAEQ